MINRSYATLWLLPAILSLAACEGSQVETGASDETGMTRLEVSPASTMVLGFFERREISVAVKDPSGAPVCDSPLGAGIVGNANNADLSPLETRTDSDGKATFVFTAPDTEGSLSLRFSSPEAGDAEVPVEVDPDHLRLDVVVEYEGFRDLQEVDVQLWEGVECGSLPEEEAPMDRVVMTVDFPLQAVFSGLRANETYALLVTAVGPDGQERGKACSSGLASGVEEVVVVDDLPLRLEGIFEISASLAVGETLDDAVFQLLGAAGALTGDTAGYLLDVLGASMGDASVEAEFEAIRAGVDLDGLLAQDLVDRGIDLESEMISLGESLGDRLAVLELRSRLEIGPGVDGEHDFYHWLGSLSFGEESDAVYQVLLSDAVQGVASISQGNPDLLELEDHGLGLGMGSVVYQGMMEELADSYGAASPSVAFEERIDCDAVADLLDEHLTGVASHMAIRLACVDATMMSQLEMTGLAALQDGAYPSLSYADSRCLFAMPEHGQLVRALVDGSLEVSWCGADCLAPFEGDFTGDLVADPS